MWSTFRKLLNPQSSLYGSIYYQENALTDDLTIGRKFIIIKYSNSSYQLFYQTSGTNTHISGTWFPCDGFLLDYDGDETFEKLYRTKFSQSLKKDHHLFKLILKLNIDKMDNETEIWRALLGRFGTLQFLYISYLLGNGIWLNDDFTNIIIQHFQFPKKISENHLKLNIKQIQNIEELNRYTAHAISTNYCKNEYDDNINHFVDYNHWYDDFIDIATESGTSLFFKKKGKPIPECKRHLYVTYKKKKYLTNMFLYWNLAKIECQSFDKIQKDLLSKLRSDT
jgi:hypothetical protein